MCVSDNSVYFFREISENSLICLEAKKTALSPFG